MTVSSSLVLEVSHNGNGVTTSFAFNFPTTADSQVRVWRYDTDGVGSLQTLGVGYTMSRGATSGTVTPSPVLATGEILVIKSNYPVEQSTSFSSQARFLPAIHDAAMDYIVLSLMQRLQELDDHLEFPTDPRGNASLHDVDIALVAGDLFTYEGEDVLALLQAVMGLDLDAADLAAVAAIATKVTTVAGIAANVTTVADNISNVIVVRNNIASVNTVAADIADVNTVAANITAITTNAANIATVAGSIANVNTVAGSIANVNTVAGSIANVNTVAAGIANINTVAGAITDVGTVADNVADVVTVADNMASVIAIAGDVAAITALIEEYTMRNIVDVTASGGTTALKDAMCALENDVILTAEHTAGTPDTITIQAYALSAGTWGTFGPSRTINLGNNSAFYMQLTRLTARTAALLVKYDETAGVDDIKLYHLSFDGSAWTASAGNSVASGTDVMEQLRMVGLSSTDVAVVDGGRTLATARASTIKRYTWDGSNWAATAGSSTFTIGSIYNSNISVCALSENRIVIQRTHSGTKYMQVYDYSAGAWAAEGSNLTPLEDIHTMVGTSDRRLLAFVKVEDVAYEYDFNGSILSAKLGFSVDVGSNPGQGACMDSPTSIVVAGAGGYQKYTLVTYTGVLPVLR